MPAFSFNGVGVMNRIIKIGCVVEIYLDFKWVQCSFLGSGYAN